MGDYLAVDADSHLGVSVSRLVEFREDSRVFIFFLYFFFTKIDVVC